MWISESLKVVYLATPRTASRAVAQWLKDGHGAYEMHHSDAIHGPWSSHHGFDFNKLRLLRGRGYHVFCTVRNPWDTIVSWYYNRGNYQQGIPGFKAFARDFPRTDAFGTRDEMFWIFVRLSDAHVRYEDLEQGLGVACRLAMKPKLEMKGRSSHRAGRHYREYYDAHPGLADWVAQQYQKEIRRFGYEY